MEQVSKTIKMSICWRETDEMLSLSVQERKLWRLLQTLKRVNATARHVGSNVTSRRRRRQTKDDRCPLIRRTSARRWDRGRTVPGPISVGLSFPVISWHCLDRIPSLLVLQSQTTYSQHEFHTSYLYCVHVQKDISASQCSKPKMLEFINLK